MRAFVRICLCVSALAHSSFAQQTALNEDFNAGVVPPSGWEELNNGATLGWEPDASGEKAEHGDFFAGAFNDNRLLSPSMDLTNLSEVYLHLTQDQEFPTFRQRNAIEISLDGGLSFATLYEEQTVDSFQDNRLEVDLTAYAGLSGVQVSFHYEGDFANLWRIDNVVVDDVAPPPPALLWPHLPSQFVSARGFHESFESAAGTVPPYAAVNALHAVTRQDDPEAWCNLGQNASSLNPYDGSFALELGKAPGGSSTGDVSNALILGLNGANSDSFKMTFQALQFGEEFDSGEDGVFVSLDGASWTAAASDWAQLIGSAPGVRALVEVDLTQAGLDLSGDFYVAIAQRDDFPYGSLDGVGIDNITIDAPLLGISNLAAGQTATFEVEQALPSSTVIIAYATTPGPTATPFGDAAVGPNYNEVGRFVPDATGKVSTPFFVPPLAAGRTVWFQAVELVGTGDGLFSNGLVLIVE